MAFVFALSCVTVHGETDSIRGLAAPVTVFTHFEERQSPAVFEVMKTEVAAIMNPMGLDFEWRPLDSHRSGAVAAELVVVTFKGSCRMEQVFQPRPEPGALGWTHTSEGEVLPFSDIDCDRIRGFIGRRVIPKSLHEREMMLGRALGRVLAHEFYHVFANTKQHGKKGVAKPFYSAADLVSEKFVFEQKESHALRTRALPALIRARGPLPAASALTAK